MDNHRYEVTVYWITAGKNLPRAAIIHAANSVTLDKDGILSIDADRGGHRFPCATWGSFEVTRVSECTTNA